MSRATLLLSLLFVFVWAVPKTTAHEYADGFVERSLALVVRGQRVYGEYSVGLNTATADAVEQRWRQHSQAPSEGQPEMPIPQAPVGGVGEHLTDPETIQRLGTVASDWLADHLKVQCNGEPVKLESIRVEPASRHPYSFTIKFEFDALSLPSGEAAAEKGARHATVDLLLVDKLFPNDQGALRYALKGTGRSMLLRSNVAPILVRADRIELAGMEESQRSTANRLVARLAIPLSDR